MSGEVKILRGSQALDAKVGIHVEVNDRIVSGAAGRVGLILRDGTRISLGPATEFVVEKFAYDPDQGLFALAMKLLRGSAVYISGKVASFAPAAVKLETPVGSVGLRGTRFAIRIGQP